MNRYHPYQKMGASCELREIGDKRVVWPKIVREYTDKSFRFRPMGKADIAEVVELWRASYPEVYGSIHEWMLHPDEYEERVALTDRWADDAVTKDHAVLVGEDTSLGKILVAMMMTKWDQNLHVEASFIAIHPDFRKGKLSVDVFSELATFYEWLKDTGAEYVTVFCETWQNITQFIWFKRMGWKVAGIFPGSYTRWAGDNQEYRGCTVHFYRLINDGARYSTLPKEWQLIPEMQELWACLEKINEQGSDDGLSEPGKAEIRRQSP